MNSTCDKDDSIIRQLPAGTQRAASLPLHQVPVHFWLGCPSAKLFYLIPSAESPPRLAHYPSICISLLLRLLLFILVLLPLAFMFLYKRVLSVNSNYPPFFSLNQGFGYRTWLSVPSKQFWLWCWPRFTVLLEQYVLLCLGCSFGAANECTHSSVIVYSLSSARQSAINVKWRAVCGVFSSERLVLY